MSLTGRFHTGQRQDSGKAGRGSMAIHSRVERNPVPNGQYVIWEVGAIHLS